MLYIVGMPLTVWLILYRRRNHLFASLDDDAAALTRSQFGFLYEVGVVVRQ